MRSEGVGRQVGGAEPLPSPRSCHKSTFVEWSTFAHSPELRLQSGISRELFLLSICVFAVVLKSIPKVLSRLFYYGYFLVLLPLSSVVDFNDTQGL